MSIGFFSIPFFVYWTTSSAILYFTLSNFLNSRIKKHCADLEDKCIPKSTSNRLINEQEIKDLKEWAEAQTYLLEDQRRLIKALEATIAKQTEVIVPMLDEKNRLRYHAIMLKYHETMRDEELKHDKIIKRHDDENVH